MADPSNNKAGEQGQVSTHNFAADLAHDFGGAIIFSIPILMTMEMWWLGFYMDRFRLALFLVFAFLLVMGLSYIEGGEETFKIEVLDALTACAVGYVVAAVMLFLFGIIKPGMSADELMGKIALHAVPCSIGAILARRQLGGGQTHKEQKRQDQYGGKIFLMGVGAIFSARFFWSVFMRLTIVGYALVLLLSLYVLWTFGRLDGVAVSEAMMSILVLGIPAAVGASAARLIL